MERHVVKSEWVRKHFVEPVERAKALASKEGREQGLEKGLEKGLQKGLQKGLKEGLQKGLEKGREQGLQAGRKTGLIVGYKMGLDVVIRSKLKAVPRRYQSAIRKLDDPHALLRLIRAISLAPDAHHVRQVLSEALRRPASRRKVA